MTTLSFDAAGAFVNSLMTDDRPVTRIGGRTIPVATLSWPAHLDWNELGIIALNDLVLAMGETSMSTWSCTYLSAAVALTAAMLSGAAAMAADLPKEGSYKGSYAGVGTLKSSQVGKDRMFEVFDETGLEVTDGFLDHTTWHCWGTGDFTNGMGNEQGVCVGTDTDGDKVITSFVSEKHTPDQKNWGQKQTCTGGTGKYVGATCSETDVMHLNEFPPASEGTYVLHVTIEGIYKFQAPDP